MFLFYDFEKQTEKNASYHKGVLFEKLLSDHLTKNGYTVEIRAKHNSLEYDLEGVSKTTQARIIGEAKAYQESITGQTLTSFVGKLLGLGLTDKKVHGLFLSSSPLTPDAKDYHSSVKDFGITCFSGEELFNSVVESLQMPSKELVFSKTVELGYNPLFDFILTTNYGYRKLVIASNASTLTPSCFLVFDNNLNVIGDENILKKLENMKELRGLQYICGEKSSTIQFGAREIRKGLLIGKDWTDYRSPAAPDFFVGREKLIEQIMSYITNNQTEPHVIQLKSRSGVGKSSTLALLSEKLLAIGCSVELHDARDIKSAVDIFSVIGRFTGANKLPQNFSEVEEQLKIMQADKKHIFMVDQFESTFSQPEIFTSYETLAKVVFSISNNIYFCLARKNDQLTTYDDSLISLKHLNSFSKNYELVDFTKEEAKVLLDKINENNSKAISKDVLSYVLEFAQGFPWLLKRTMSHIIKLSGNISQRKLIDTGLMLDDLFEEELFGLEELEKEYLAKICAKLPADVHQLQIAFDEDALLPKMLDKFTEVRLLRMSGSTYDTYNDVFKEYLVYQKLPEFRHKHIFRQQPNGTMRFFAKIVSRQKFTLSQLSKSLKTSEKSLANYIKECRNLGLIKKDGDYWIIPKNIKDMYLQVHLGMYIRRQVLNNELVSLIVKTLNTKSMSNDDVTEAIKAYSPYVEASETTWRAYSRTLTTWLVATRIARLDKQSNLLLENLGVDLGESLGNMINSSYGKGGRHSSRDFFLPSVSWKYYEALFKMLKNGDTSFSREYKKAYVDLKQFNMIEQVEDCNDIDTFKSLMINECFSTANYAKIWSAANEGGDIRSAVSNLIDSDITQSTLMWRCKKIINCGKELLLIKNKRYTYK